jgi:hypothetical protein
MSGGMKVYVAGKITGDPECREKFALAAAQLTAQGHVVLNPAMLPDGLTNREYMNICFAMMNAAEAVAFLPDAGESKGARLEYGLLCYCQDKQIVRL